MHILANHHAHSNFSDGIFEPEVYLEQAISQGLVVYGFSDHAPIPVGKIGAMPLLRLPIYLEEIDRLKAVYGKQIQIYKGLEVDYIPGWIDLNSEHIQEANLDYTIGAVHYVGHLASGRPWGFQSSHQEFEKGLHELYDGDIRACASAYYGLIRDMVQQACPNIVAHLDRIKKLNQGDRYFREADTWYRDEVTHTLKVIADAGAILEVNTKGYYSGSTDDTYPGKWILEIAHDMNISVQIGSDAHHPDNITKGFDYAEKILLELGYTSTKILLDGVWQDVSLKRASLHSME